MPPLTRRALLKSAAAAGLVAALPRRLAAQAAPSSGHAAVLAYLARHLRADHGYAFADQDRSHLAPTFAVIGAYRLLGETPPHREALRAYVRAHHPRELKKLEQERRIFDYQQVQALAWLGDDAADFRPRFVPQIAPLPYLKQYERHGYPVFQSELGLVKTRALLGLPLAPLASAFFPYIEARRRAAGGYNNTPAAEGGDGHVMNTLWALEARRLLAATDHAATPAGPAADIAATVAWLRACQLPGGGFTYQPQSLLGGVDDVAYTRAAVRALRLLGAAPADPAACVAWLRSLATADGGFGDRPGWDANPAATHSALDALDALGALGDTLATLRPPAPRARPALPAGLRVWSIQIQAHGNGSPAEAVALAAALRIDLWGAKNAAPAWLARTRALAAARGAPVQFFRADEEYGTWLDFPGLGTYSHMSDLVAPADTDIGSPLGTRNEISPPVSWPEFRTRRLAPLTTGSGRLVWQFGENEELVRAVLDDSLERGGYAAISTFHFGNPDFLNTEPFLQRWRGKIPFIGLQDAHGPEPWWFADMTEGYRTLFLAPEPTWEGWLEALRTHRVAAVRHDAVSRGETWIHAGSDEVVAAVRASEAEWRWWDNPAVRRPLVSLVVLSPTDTLEAAHPEKGVALRVRCAWRNTAQGLPQTPLAEFIALTVDGVAAAPSVVERRRAKGEGLADRYHLLTRADFASGLHVAVATVRDLATGRTESARLEFSV
jgi:hypothetical protein